MRALTGLNTETSTSVVTSRVRVRMAVAPNVAEAAPSTDMAPPRVHNAPRHWKCIRLRGQALPALTELQMLCGPLGPAVRQYNNAKSSGAVQNRSNGQLAAPVLGGNITQWISQRFFAFLRLPGELP